MSRSASLRASRARAAPSSRRNRRETPAFKRPYLSRVTMIVSAVPRPARACGGPASLLALLRRREALARTPRLGRRRRALGPRRALRRALRRRRRRRLRRGLRRRLRLGSGRSLLALRLRELLADDDDHLRVRTVGQGFSAGWDRDSARARCDRDSARSCAAAADGERRARVCICVAVACQVCICAFGRATRCAAWRPGARSGLGARGRTAIRTTTGTSGFTNDTIVSSCGAQREWAREPCEAAVARADARMGPRARAPCSPSESAPRRTP